MRRFRRLFALLFILSLFVGVFHEIDHAHAVGDTCEVCLFAHSPVVLDDAGPLIFATVAFELQIFTSVVPSYQQYITAKSRAPPLFS
jgi:hypothetical protein